jgi:hypothetical protein
VKSPNGLSHKGDEIEEWVDLKFFRPLGYRLAAALQHTRISADQVTLWSLLTGLVGGHLFLYHNPWLNLAGFGIFIVSDVFDSADGQLARLRGNSTRLGRVLDGISDSLRFVNLFIHLGIRIFLEMRARGDVSGLGSPFGCALLILLALGSISLQSAAIDFIRTAYFALSSGEEKLDLPEDMSSEGRKGCGGVAGAKPEARVGFLPRVAGSVYASYLREQGLLFSRSMRLSRDLRAGTRPATFGEAYRRRQARVLPHCGWLGHNIRFALLPLTAGIGHPGAFFLITIVPMNIILALLVSIHEAGAGRLREELSAERSPHGVERGLPEARTGGPEFLEAGRRG